MNIENLIRSLERFGSTLPVLVKGQYPTTMLAGGPESGNYSILEVVCHLVEEEMFDFRARVISTLEDPSRQWSPIDPAAWAQERDYNSKDLDEQVQLFVNERRKSIEMIKSVSDPEWNNTYQHPHIGPLRAGDLMSAWAAHDHLHARQIAKRNYEIVQRDAGNYSTQYAGNWTA